MFRDGDEIIFSECVHVNTSTCVAERDFTANPPYFRFFNKNIRVIYDSKGIFSKSRNDKVFHNLQFELNRYGYTTYDLS